jgi:hypothetical protein
MVFLHTAPALAFLPLIPEAAKNSGCKSLKERRECTSKNPGKEKTPHTPCVLQVVDNG